MNYQTVLWVLFGVLLITFSIVRKKRNKKLNVTLFALMIFIMLGPTFMPRQLFGKWNSISKLEGKKITAILLQPSEPNWEVNLVGKDFLISNKKQIDAIAAMLQKAEVYFPGLHHEFGRLKWLSLLRTKTVLKSKFIKQKIMEQIFTHRQMNGEKTRLEII